MGSCNQGMSTKCGIHRKRSCCTTQERRYDAEHPMVIPMDLSSSHQVPRGPMTRARARALETEVTSLLNELPYESCETWLLPQTEMLCMLRYLEDPSEDAREDGQVPKSTDEEERRKELE